MATVAEGVVNAPVGTVWALVSDVERWLEWDPDLSKVHGVEGDPAEAGTRFKLELKNGTKGSPVVLESEPRVRFLVGGPINAALGFEMDFKMEARGEDATHLRYRFELTGLLGKVVGWLQSSWIQAGTNDGFDNLKRLAESHASAGVEEDEDIDLAVADERSTEDE